ncbi:MAG: Fe-S oxidoreductase [Firmicutes bacterium]|nr:Fe-S oxidoreductase [Bacillota bacterium]
MGGLHYEGAIFRPPSEASSLILQISIGCSHNACTFCIAYKKKVFRTKSWPEIEADIAVIKKNYPTVQRIFLADGNALCLDTEILLKTLHQLYRELPLLERVSIYGAPQDILQKTPEELKEIRNAGLEIIYFGLESGSDNVLTLINKNVSAAQMVEACHKAQNAGFSLSVTAIAGLGGQALTEEHAVETASVISAINPTYFSILTLMVVKTAPLYKQIQRDEFRLLTPLQDLQEIRLLLDKSTLTNCIFRSNHASNYVPLRGILNRDKNALIALLDKALADPTLLRPESTRGL